MTASHKQDDVPKKRQLGRGLVKFLRSLSFQMSVFLCGAMYCTMFSNLNMSVTILAMVNTTFAGCTYIHGNFTPRGCVASDHVAELSDYVSNKQVSWSPKLQGLVLSAISWGRVLAPILGPLVDRSDARIILPISLLVAAVASAVIPISTKVGAGLVMFWRMLIGIADATINPTTSKLLSQQFTPSARVNALTWTSAGRQLGILTVYPLAAYISDSHAEGEAGWPMVFYICSTITMGFVVLWIGFTVCRRKKLDKKISTVSTSSMVMHNGKLVKPPVPWKAMALSGVLWSNILAVLCHEAPMSAIMMFLPMYMRDVLHFCMKTNGMLSALPIACFLVFKILATHLSHILQLVFQIDRTKLAKGFNFVACLGLGGFLLSVTWLDCRNRTAAVILICLSIGFAGFHTPGCLSTLLSIAPTFSGTIASIAYFFASLSAMLIPLVVKSIVIYGTKAEWQVVLIGAGCIALMPIVFFTLFGSADEQPWALPPQSKVSSVVVDKF